MSLVFLSHSSKDKHLARRLAIDLEEAGIDVWFDEWEIKVGDSISQKIQHGLENVDFVAVLLSSNSVKSGWVEKEWQSKIGQEAKTRRVIILPLKLDDCMIPPLLQDKRYADFASDYDDAFQELLTCCGTAQTTVLSTREAIPDKSLVFASIASGSSDKNWDSTSVDYPASPFSLANWPIQDGSIKLRGHDGVSIYRKCKFAFRVWAFLGDPILDITVINQSSKSILLTHIGVEIAALANVYRMPVTSTPQSIVVKSLAKYTLEMPRMHETLWQNSNGIDSRNSTFMCEIQKDIILKLPDPIYIESKAPFRYELFLKNYSKNTPEIAFIKIMLRTSKGWERSEDIYMQNSENYF